MFACVSTGNLVTIAILCRGKCGLSKCITKYLVAMAVTDLLVLILAVLVNRMGTIYFPASFLSLTPICSLKLCMVYAARDSSVWFTVAFTMDRFIAICCQKLKARYCTEKTATIIIGTIGTMTCLKNVPMYFIYEPLYSVNGVPWFCNIMPSFYSEIWWTACDCIHYILNPCVPFLLMLFMNAVTVKNILEANRARRRLRSQGRGENQNDPEVENRKKSIVLLFTISGSFIVLWTLYVVNFMYVRFTNSGYVIRPDLSDPRFLLRESGIVLQLLSCCTNTCIYAGTQRKFREEFKNAVAYIVSPITKLARK